MSHAALSRLNSRHNFTSSDVGLHQEGVHSSPFAKAKAGSFGAKSPPTEWASAEPSLRNEVAKKELASKLKSRQASMSMAKQMDDASVVSKASGAGGDDDDDERQAEEEEEDYGDVYDWRFDGTAEGDRENEKHLHMAVQSGGKQEQPNHQPGPSTPTGRQGLASSFVSGYSLTSLASSFSSSNSAAASAATSFQERSLQTARSLQKLTRGAATTLAQAVTAFGEPEPETLIARSESFMKLHTLKAPQSPINNWRRENDQVVEGGGQDTERKMSSIVSAIDAAMGTLGTKKAISQVTIPKKLMENVTREDVFPKNAHVITFAPKQPAPPEGEYRTLFDVQAARSFRLEKRNSPASRSHGKLAPLHNPQQPSFLPPDKAPTPSPELRSLMGSGIMRPPPLNLNVTPGGSAVRGQSFQDLSAAAKPTSVPPLMSPIASNKGGRGTPKHGGANGSASPSASASSSFLSQALKKTSSYLSIPLPVLALQPDKQKDVFVPSGDDDQPKSESVDSFLKTASSFLGLQTSPVVAKLVTPKAKTGLLSERHKKVIADASPGVGTPVIYVPHTARSEASAASLHSTVTGVAGLLEVGPSSKAGRFQPASLRHLDLSVVAEAPPSEHDELRGNAAPEVPDVGPNKPIKQLDDTWAACWDDEAGAVYYYNQHTGEATWLPPRLDDAAAHDEPDEVEDFFRLLNNGLPRGLSEFNMGDSELTLKTRKIAARHKLWSKLRNRYEGDATTEFTSTLEEKDKSHYGKLEDSEVLWEYQKEVADWLID